MILDGNTGLAGVLWDAAAGRIIPHAFWADTDSGVYLAYRAGPDGEKAKGPDGRPIKFRGYSARLRFVPAPLLPKPAVAEVRAPVPELPAKAPTAEPLRRVNRRCLVLTGQHCDSPTCWRLAEWETADFRDLPPETSPDGKRFRRSQLVAQHFWCWRCYRNPGRVYPDGSKDAIEVRARPQ